MRSSPGKRQYPDSARAAAWGILNDWDGGRGALEALREEYLSGSSMDERDRALVTELTQGVMRYRLMLDYRIDSLLDKPGSSLPVPIYNMLRLGIYQILHLTKIPIRAAVNESVELVKSSRFRGLAPLVNAVMRKAAKAPPPELPDEEDDPAGYIALTTSNPRWLVDMLVTQMGRDEARHLLQAMNRPPSLTFRVNTLKVNRDELLDELASLGVSARPGSLSAVSIILESRGDPSTLPPFMEGRCTVQDEGAQLVAPLLMVRKADLVLDACASPGGKAGHLAQEMSDKGTIIAIDNSLPRVRMMKQTLDRLDLRSVKSVVGDVLSVPTLFRAPLDKILLDVPCSGTGVLGRHPEGKWRKDRAGIDVLKAVQLQMLNSLGTILQKGGELLYTTCSLLVEENENVIDGFIEDSSYSLVDLRSRGNSLPADVFTKRGELKVLPHIHGCDGFYAALLEKR